MFGTSSPFFSWNAPVGEARYVPPTWDTRLPQFESNRHYYALNAFTPAIAIDNPQPREVNIHPFGYPIVPMYWLTRLSAREHMNPFDLSVSQ